MPALKVCAPLTQVTLSWSVCNWSVPVKGHLLSRLKFGAPVMPCPADWALYPLGKPKLTCGSRFRVLALPGLIRGSVSALPLLSVSGNWLCAYVLAPPVDVSALVSVNGPTPC